MVEEQSHTPPHLHYWAIRGLGAYVRYTFEAAGAPYTETRYTEPTAWFQDTKPHLPLLLPNLPCLVFKDSGVSETDSIVRLVARKHKPELLGKNEMDYALTENIFSFLVKWNAELRTNCYKDDITDEQRKKLITDKTAQLTALNKHLNGKKFFMGDYETIADIWFYETWIVAKLIHEDSCKDFTEFENHAKHFEELEWFKNYKNSDKWIEKPINGPQAKINNM
jgi:glutathione S-transferase